MSRIKILNLLSLRLATCWIAAPSANLSISLQRQSCGSPWLEIRKQTWRELKLRTRHLRLQPPEPSHVLKEPKRLNVPNMNKCARTSFALLSSMEALSLPSSPFAPKELMLYDDKWPWWNTERGDSQLYNHTAVLFICHCHEQEGEIFIWGDRSDTLFHYFLPLYSSAGARDTGLSIGTRSAMTRGCGGAERDQRDEINFKPLDPVTPRAPERVSQGVPAECAEAGATLKSGRGRRGWYCRTGK